MEDSKKIYCNDCENLFEITADDVYKVQGQFYVECPYCHSRIALRSTPQLIEWYNIRNQHLKEKWAKEGTEKKVKRMTEPELVEFWEELEKNYSPIKEDLGLVKPEGKTKEGHIEELQEILMQTCIDYINKYGLTDIWGVYFQADNLSASAKFGEWTPSTDSSISVEGIGTHKFIRENGEEWSTGERYEIGQYM